jgi:hypothetical protein
MKSPLLLCALLALPVLAATPGPPTVAIPPGKTPLTDIGIYRVFWQSRGKEPVAMPDSWMGHFDPATGISYQPWGVVAGRPALLMHSPWRVPPGITWVEYSLQLPRATPIKLSFGIAMGADVVGPDKSDGVTFSCRLETKDGKQELMRKNYDRAEWLDYSFDLSKYAGEPVKLALEVDPGPKDNASFDFSFFGDASITAGKAGESARDTVVRLSRTKAYLATAGISLAGFANPTNQTLAPGNLLRGTTRLEETGGAWRFVYDGADARVVYTYRPATGSLSDFTAQVDGTPAFLPADGGGLTVMEEVGGKKQERQLSGGRAVAVRRDGTGLAMDWEYARAGKPLRVAWHFSLVGKALMVGVACESPVVTRFSLGNVGGAALRRTFSVPYLLQGNPHYLFAQNAYVCRFFDWKVSHASSCPQGGAVYEPKTDGTRNPLCEQGYIAVSPNVQEVLPAIPNPASPFRDMLGPCIMLDIWGHHRGTYAGDAENLRNLKDLGVDHMVIIQHDWQRYGYDVKLPDHIPANPAYGGEEGMKLFGQAANECGYRWSVHENYIDLYPDAPSYDALARVLREDGSPSPAWYNPGTKVQSYGLKSNRALEFAKQNAPEIHRRYGTTAAYLDVHSSVVPWHQLDHDATQPLAAMELAKVQNDTALFQYMRGTHQGPLFGEGANQFYWAGLCDGVEAQVQGGEDHQAFLDLDLLRIHPRMVNHGMGYYERWFRRGYDHQLGFETGTMEQIDKYRAMELAYGHAGFVGSPHDHNWHWVVREHQLMHPVQRLYGTSRPVDIEYEVAGQLVTASAALPAGDTARQRIRYESGLTLWVNWKPEPWKVEGRTLPQWGSLAKGPETEVSTALHDGRIADYAECPEYVFADARTYAYMPYRRAPVRIEPRLKDFAYLGGDRVRATYEWVVGETISEDYHCFVHGSQPAGGDVPEKIVFQQDHPLPKPTSQWRVGEVITDGPYEFPIAGPGDAFDLTIGMFKTDRLALKGVDDGHRRIILAKLKVTRENGRITGITAAKPDVRQLAATPAEADFTAHLNPPGTWVDFGKVATDGAVKINRDADRLVIFPYPRDCQFKLSLDVKALAPKADGRRIKLTALAAGDQRNLGEVPFQMEKGRLVFQAGMAGAGRYAVSWE